MKQQLQSFRSQYIRLDFFRHLAFAMVVALSMVASVPQDALAQRTKTDKGKVTVERGKAKSAQKSGTRTSRTKSTGSASRKAAAKSSSSSNRRGVSSRADNRASSGARNTQARTNRGGKAQSGRSVDTRARGATNGGRAVNVGSKNVIKGKRSNVVVPRRAPIRVKSGRKYVRYSPRPVIHIGSRRAYRPQSRISIHIAWPWVVRYERHWSPRYRYRQVVYVQSRWGKNNRSARVEMETVYRHKVKYATDEYAVLDIEIEEVALYENGQYLGTVDRIPSSLSKIEATVYSDGQIDFDQDVFVVGDRRAGFEMISTPFYNDYALAQYNVRDGYRVGVLNLRSGRVSRTSRSRLFDPRDYNGFAPISLLPEDEGWLWDYGVDAISAVSDDYDTYYGYTNGASGAYRSGNQLSAASEYSYSTEFGAKFDIKRESHIQRVE